MHPSATEEEMEDLLNYRKSSTRRNPIDDHRDEIIEFIERNKGRLSLPCSGNCYEHSDAVVLFCHRSLTKER